jgi:ELWxxDGT repeat protein
MMRNLTPLFLLLFLISTGLSGQLRFEFDENTSPLGGNPGKLTLADGKVYFLANDGFHGAELWCHDPATDQTFMTLDITPGSSGTPITQLTVFNSALYFVIEHSGHQLWRVKAGETVPEQLTFADNLGGFEHLVVVGDHLMWLGTGNDSYRLWVMGSDEQLVTSVPAENRAHTVAVLDDQLYIFYLFGDGIYRYDISAEGIDTVAQNTADFPDVYRFYSTTAFDGKLFFATNSGSDSFGPLVYYDPVTDSLVNTQIELAPYNLFREPVVRVDDRLFLQTRTVKEYLPATNTAIDPPGMSETDQLQPVMQKMGGKLLLYGMNLEDTEEANISIYDPMAGSVTDVPELSASRYQRTYSDNTPFIFLGDSWYFRGGEAGQNLELYEFQPAEASVMKIKDIHGGTQSAIIRDVSHFTTEEVLVTTREKIYSYNPELRVSEDLTTEFAGLVWNGNSNAHSFPGYLVLTNVTYQDTLYQAIAYDSIQQVVIPILENTGWCSASNGDRRFPMTMFNGEIWLATCQPPTDRLSLYRHTPGEPGTTFVPIPEELTLVQSSNGKMTLTALDDRLLFIVDSLDFSLINDNDLMAYHPDQGFETIDRGDYRMEGFTFWHLDSITYLQAITPQRKRLTLIYQPTHGLRPLTYLGDSLNFRVYESVVAHDDQHYFLASLMDTIRLFSYDGVGTEVSLVADFPLLDLYYELQLHSGDLYFEGAEPEFGSELYRYVFETGDIERLADINRGSKNGMARSLASLGDRLFFVANDGFRGTELWSYQPDCFSIELTASASFIDEASGEVLVDIMGGQPPYSYLWQDGETTASRTEALPGFYEVTVTDALGCSSSQMVWVETDGLINSTEDAETGSIKVYPNPFHGRLQLDFSASSGSPTGFTIHSMNGQQLRSGLLSAGARAELDLTGLPSGLFVLVLTGRGGSPVLVQKIVKQ